MSECGRVNAADKRLPRKAQMMTLVSSKRARDNQETRGNIDE
ncbi:hypothetical protein MY11210_008280, partial [Beauveria gryllotalpidicola]